MTKYLTEYEYKVYLDAQAKFEAALITAAQAISEIINGRRLRGEFDGDLDMWDEGNYYVRFMEDDYSDDSEGVYVPERYIYDGDYREAYNEHLINEKKLKAKAILKREEERKANTFRIVIDERAEYERLKAKFDPPGRKWDLEPNL
ncbi:MAG: hypothetical protein ACTSPB_06720 [Candidatus Thorarchaeota archaeon]